MISVSGVSMRYGSKVLFEDVTTTFSKGRRYGLTGPNGAGKSTFMKLLTGELDPQRGTVVRPAKLGVLRQDQFAFDEFRVIDTVIMGNQRLWSALEEREQLYAKPDMTDEDGMRLGELEGHRRRRGRLYGGKRRGHPAAGPGHPRRAARAEDGRAAGRPEGARAAGAGALRPPAGAAARRADEPPGPRLDPLAARVPGRYDGTLIVISHDRHFLNAVCTHIADIDYQTIITYTGGYDDMVVAKTQIRSHHRVGQRAAREEDRPAERLHRAVLGAGTRASQVTSRRKEVERLQTTELARSNIQRPYIKFAMNRPSGKVAVELEERVEGLRRPRRSSPTSAPS